MGTTLATMTNPEQFHCCVRELRTLRECKRTPHIHLQQLGCAAIGEHTTRLRYAPPTFMRGRNAMQSRNESLLTSAFVLLVAGHHPLAARTQSGAPQDSSPPATLGPQTVSNAAAVASERTDRFIPLPSPRHRGSGVLREDYRARSATRSAVWRRHWSRPAGLRSARRKARVCGRHP